MSELERTEHGDDCECTRCRGFEPGNGLSTRHGAYAVLRLAPRAEEIATVLREELGDAVSERFEVAVQSAAPIGARYEQALLALVDGDPSKLSRLDEDARSWARLWFAALDRLGLTPQSAARIAKDTGIGRATRASAAIQRLERHIEGQYGAGRDGGA